MMMSSKSFLINSNVTMCCFGANHVGVSISTVIAYNCPQIHVSVIDFDPDQINLWNQKQIPIQEPDLERMFQKCLNDNLIFVTDMRSAIVLADIVFIVIDVPIVKSKDQLILNAKEFEEAARTIAKLSESSKIIVQKCIAPFRSYEFLKTILNANKSKNVHFQVLTMPEFFSYGSMQPELILIGHDGGTEDNEAAVTVATIFSHWVPWERIKIMKNRSAELVRIGINVLLAQKLITFGSFGALCEESGMNARETNNILKTAKDVGDQYMDPGFSLGELNLKKDILNLLQICQKNNFTKLEEYWKEVLNQSDYQETRFKNKILTAFGGKINNKKFAVFGISFKGNGEISSELPALKLSSELLKEGARLSLYDPNVKISIKKVSESIAEWGVENVEEHTALFDDPYGAAYMVDGIILCSNLSYFKSLDYSILYRGMGKPAYLFDGENLLNHEALTSIGFNVKSIDGGL